MEVSDTLGLKSILVEDYEIIRVLGSGGFGNTYLALDKQLNREVAIKEFYPREIALREDQTTVRVKGARFEGSFNWGMERFVQEARLLAKFRHSNIVRVFRTFDANNTSYIVLDYVRGADLEAWLKELGRRPTQDEMDLLLEPLLDALSFVHAAGILHRDIKPANICVREETGDPVLLDFGASKYSMSEMTGTTAAIVSRGYSPYEAYAADSKKQGAWTDIYGLGATVYRALTNEPPPEATERLLDDTMVTLKSQAQTLQGYRPEFLAAVDWALSVQPASRPQNVADWRTRIFAGRDSAIKTWESEQRRLGGNTEMIPGGGAAARTGADGGAQSAASQRTGKRRPLALVLGSLVALAGAGAIGAWQLELVDRKWLAGAGQSATAPSSSSGGTREANAVGPAPATAPIAAPPVKTADAANVAAASSPRPDPRARTLGTEGDGQTVTALAVSPDGRTIIGGGLRGSLRLWDTASGRQNDERKPTAESFLAVDFANAADQSILAVTADGTLRSWDADLQSPKLVSNASLPNGFILALAYSMKSRDIVTVATSEKLTQIARWRTDIQTPIEKYDLGYMIRAAAIARAADLAVVVKADETIEGFRYMSEQPAERYAFVTPATDWTTSVAVTPDARLLARGGHYQTVQIYDIGKKRALHEIRLGEQRQMQTRGLAFSPDGKQLAIDYQRISDRALQNWICVVSTDSGHVLLDIESDNGNARGLSFVPNGNGSYGLAVAQAGTVRICDATSTCQFTDQLVEQSVAQPSAPRKVCMR